ncbi:MAG: DMT family transporter [Candidatus Chisholmbacteria bacterium]|nr:DMT family transporter [Candidatus Chisholmbacteria bacterium]
MWLVYTLAAAGLWGVGQVLTKRGLVQITPLWNNLVAYGWVIVIMIPWAVNGGVSWDRLPIIFPLTLLTAAAYSIYFYVVSRGEIALTGTINSAYPLATVILAKIFLGETTSGLQNLGIVATLVGAVLIAWPKNIRVKLESWVWWGTAGAIIVGSADFLTKLIIGKSDVYTFTLSHELAFIPVLVGLWLMDKGGRSIPKFNLRSWWPTLTGVGMMQVGVLSFFIALSLGKASLVAPVSSIYQAITVVLAMIWLKEKVSLRQLTGIILAIGGILLLAGKA